MKKTILIMVGLLVAVSLSACSKPAIFGKKDVKDTVQTENQVGNATEEITENKCREMGKKFDADTKTCVATENIISENNNLNTTDNTKKENEEQKEVPIVLQQQTLLILDASGSMWGKVDGKAKIDIAKEVVKQTVKDFQSTELGLMAYGHRRKGDCKDIKLVPK